MEKTVLVTMSVEELQDIIYECLDAWSRNKKAINSGKTLVVYTTEDLQKMFKVSKRTLQAWRDNGLIGYVKVGGCIYFQQDQIERFLAENRKEPF